MLAGPWQLLRKNRAVLSCSLSLVLCLFCSLASIKGLPWALQPHGHCLCSPSPPPPAAPLLPQVSSSLLPSLQTETVFLGNFPPTCKFLHAWKPKGHFEAFNSFSTFVNLSSRDEPIYKPGGVETKNLQDSKEEKNVFNLAPLGKKEVSGTYFHLPSSWMLKEKLGA